MICRATCGSSTSAARCQAIGAAPTAMGRSRHRCLCVMTPAAAAKRLRRVRRWDRIHSPVPWSTSARARIWNRVTLIPPQHRPCTACGTGMRPPPRQPAASTDHCCNRRCDCRGTCGSWITVQWIGTGTPAGLSICPLPGSGSSAIPSCATGGSFSPPSFQALTAAG